MGKAGGKGGGQAQTATSLKAGQGVIAVASGKGGVGKTTVAVNLAWALADGGKRVLLLDADFGLSNADVLLGVSPAASLDDVLFKSLPIEQAIHEISPNLSLLSGSSGVARMAELGRGDRARLMAEFAKLGDYDYILVDNSPGLSAQVISLCLSARDIVVVVTPEATSMTDAYALIKVLRENGLWFSPLILVNRARSLDVAKRVFERLSATAKEYLGIRCLLLGFVPDDPSMELAMRERRAVLDAHPASRASFSLRGCAERLASRSSRLGREVPPERFWDNAVMRMQQRPRFESPELGLDQQAGPPGHGPAQPADASKTPPGPREAAPAPFGELPGLSRQLVAALDSLASVEAGADMAEVEPELALVQAALDRFRAVKAAKAGPATAGPEVALGPGHEGAQRPVTARSQADGQADGQAKTGGGGDIKTISPCKVLVLGRDAFMRQTLVDFASELGFEAQGQGLDAASPGGVDGAGLIIADWDGSGQRARAVLDGSPHIPAVILQGFPREGDAQVREGNVRLLSKPFQFEDLARAVLTLARCGS